MSASPDALVAQLVSLGVSTHAAVEAVVLGKARTVEEGMQLLDDARTSRVTTLYSTRWGGRPYFFDKNSGETSWTAPPCLRLVNGRIDAATFGLELAEAAEAASLLARLEESSRSAGSGGEGSAWPACRDTLRKLLSNALHHPDEPKYRRVNGGNAAVAGRLLRHDGATSLLRLCGFRPVTDEHHTHPHFQLPRDANTAVARCVVAHLDAACALTDDTAGSASAAGDTPEAAAMRRYQRVVHCCASCGSAINDGSERAITGRWDAPKGTYRFECAACGKSLCEACHDKRAAGLAGVHPVEHGTLAAVAPFTDRLAAMGGSGVSTDANPWGRFGASVSARSRERLKERSGM